MNDYYATGHYDGSRLLKTPIDPEVVQETFRRIHAKGVFDPRHERIIEGIASDGSVNSHGFSLAPAGAMWTAPLPLLWAHDWRTPLGEVVEIELIRNKLRFRARVATGVLPHADAAWHRISTGAALGISTGHDWLGVDQRPLRGGKLGSHFDAWHVAELSVCNGLCGANRNATIEFAATFNRPNAITLDPYAARWRTLHIDRRPVVRLRQPMEVR